MGCTFNPNNKTSWAYYSFIIHKNKSKLELAQYLHACAGSPVISMFQKLINNGNFITWLGIDKINFHALIQSTLATSKGHLDQERKHLQSTKISSETEIDHFPIKDKKLYECISPLIWQNKSFWESMRTI